MQVKFIQETQNNVNKKLVEDSIQIIYWASVLQFFAKSTLGFLKQKI